MTLQKHLGIELPIIQAPMAGVQGSALTVAVSNAGGLGSLPCAMLDIDTIRKELITIQAQTSKPYNLNFFCHTLPEPDEEQEGQHNTDAHQCTSQYSIREIGHQPASKAHQKP